MILGLVGKKRAGKDSVASIIKESFPFETLSFAYTLKQILREVFCLNDEQLNGDLKEVPDFRYFGWTPRQLMCWVGTEAGRNSDFSWAGKYETQLREAFLRRYLVPKSTLWVDDLLYQIQDHENIIVTDVRFCNEASALVSNGAKLIKIIRPSLLLEENHSSEQEVDKILTDETIINDGGLSDLKDKISKLRLH